MPGTLASMIIIIIIILIILTIIVIIMINISRNRAHRNVNKLVPGKERNLTICGDQ